MKFVEKLTFNRVQRGRTVWTVRNGNFTPSQVVAKARVYPWMVCVVPRGEACGKWVNPDQTFQINQR